MGFPERLLGDEETVSIHSRTHGKALILPVLVLLVTAGAASYLAAIVPSGSSQMLLRWLIIGLAVLVVLRWTLWPFLNWRTTTYTVTNERLITRSGVFTRTGRDIPLSRINDVAYEHGPIDRMLGCGTLVVESAGERGQVILTDVPHVERVQLTLSELVRHAHGDDEHDRYDADDQPERYDADDQPERYDADDQRRRADQPNPPRSSDRRSKQDEAGSSK